MKIFSATFFLQFLQITCHCMHGKHFDGKPGSELLGTSTVLFRTIIRNFIDLWDIWGHEMSQRALGHLGVPKSFLCELGAKCPKLMRYAVSRKCPKLIESCRIHTQLCVMGLKCAVSCQIFAVPSR